MRVAGIMSGTSLDGIDVAIVDVRGAGWNLKARLAGFRTCPYPRPVRAAILSVSNAVTHTAQISRLHFLLGELYAEAVIDTCAACRLPLRSLELIGCHGQTIFHESDPTPFLGRPVSSTLQIGEASIIAERTGVPVVSDFRPRDMAAGGQGAPLVPFVDYLLLRHKRRGRVALNVGGIANLTAIPPGGGPKDVIACDTGPGNMVIDALAVEATHGRLAYDKDGRLAARGHIRDDLLADLLNDRFYRLPPPKSAGREQYGEAFVERLRRTGAPLPALIATATVLTAAAAATAIERFVRPRMRVDDVVVSGGGAHNPVILGTLAALLPGCAVSTSATFGLDPDAKEAVAFAILAHETWHGRPANLPAATGARRPAVLGKITC